METETKTVIFHLETKNIRRGLVQKKGGQGSSPRMEKVGLHTRQFEPSAPAAWACALPPRPSVAPHPDLPGYGNAMAAPWHSDDDHSNPI